MTRHDLLHRRALKVLLTGRLARYPAGRKGIKLREELERFARRHRAWLSSRDLEGFSFGEKKVKGRKTANLSLIVFVRKKIRDPEKIRRPIPQRIGIPTLGMFITDVVAVGRFRHHEFKDTVRPLKPGTCLSITAGSPGTLGCFVKKAGTTAPLILTCAHVLTKEFQVNIGKDVEQTATRYQAGGRLFKVGAVSEIVPIKFTPNINDYSNQVDAGLTPVDSGLLPVDPTMRVNGIRPASVGNDDDIAMNVAVRKVGFATDETDGIIINPKVYRPFFYPDPQHPGQTLRAGFWNLVLCDYRAGEGDSGSLVMTTDGKLLGLHMGSYGDGTSLFCRFSIIAAKLGVEPY